MKACKNVKRYQGIYMPRCDYGKGCQACWGIWAKVHKTKPPKVT